MYVRAPRERVYAGPMRRAILIAVLLLSGCGTMNRLGERAGETWDSICYEPLLPDSPPEEPCVCTAHDPNSYEQPHRATVWAACVIAAAFHLPSPLPPYDSSAIDADSDPYHLGRWDSSRCRCVTESR